MKILIVLLTALVIPLSTFATTGNQHLEYCTSELLFEKDFCFGYVISSAELGNIAPAMLEQNGYNHPFKRFCIPKGVTQG
jgi:hypothetical protein